MTKDTLKTVTRRLLNDECIIGKIPKIKEEDIETLFDQWSTNKDGKIVWVEFREGLNKWEWKMLDKERLNEVVDNFFKQSYKFKMQGNDKDSKEYAARALRL